jgi:hypothetical protein
MGQNEFFRSLLGGLPVSGELLPVILRVPRDPVTKGFELLRCRTGHHLGRWPGQPRHRSMYGQAT